MLMRGDDLMNMLMQVQAPCRKCGTFFSFNEKKWWQFWK